MNLFRYWKKRRLLKRRALISELRGHNRALTSALKYKDTMRPSRCGTVSEELMMVSLTAMVARVAITSLCRKLNFSWEEARSYA